MPARRRHRPQEPAARRSFRRLLARQNTRSGPGGGRWWGGPSFGPSGPSSAPGPGDLAPGRWSRRSVFRSRCAVRRPAVADVSPQPKRPVATRLQRPVPALIVQRAGDRRERAAERARMGGQLVRVVRALVLPDLDHGEMIGAVLLVHHVEAQVAGVLAARSGSAPSARATTLSRAGPGTSTWVTT